MLSYSKMSKKQKAAIDRQRRTLWTTNPVTKIVPSKKIYNRKKVNYVY